MALLDQTDEAVGWMDESWADDILDWAEGY
jgi:hypothetical protein